SVLLPKVTVLAAKEGSHKDISDLFVRVSRLQYFVMSFILVGFIIFGKEFIIIWGGEDYVQTYYVSLIILIPFSFDLISNVGVVILQAENKLKYRSIPLIVGSLIGLVLTFPFTHYFGVYGCAWAISISILISNVLASNIVFYKIAGIDVIQYWKEVMRMSWFPVLMIVAFMLVKGNLPIHSILSLLCYILIFSLFYIPLNVMLNMNGWEKMMIYSLMLKVKNK
ncbi:lipopolysaccharide biosynthesis protein, partial [Parabacteroides distasonis]